MHLKGLAFLDALPNPLLESVEGGRRPPIVGWFARNSTLSPLLRQTAFVMHPHAFSTKRIRLLTLTIDGTSQVRETITGWLRAFRFGPLV